MSHLSAGRRGLRRSAPFLLLAASLAVAAVGAVAAHRAEASHRSTAEGLLRDYGSFAAWSFADRAGEALDRAIHGTLGTNTALLSAGNPEPCLLDLLVHKEGCGCGRSVAGSFAFHARVDTPGAPLFVGEGAPSGADQDRLIERVVRDARASYVRGQRYRVVDGGAGKLVAYVRLENARDTVVYGMELDRARVQESLEEVFRSPDLLPASLTRGLPADSLLTVHLAGPDGTTLFGAPPERDDVLSASQAMGSALPDGIVTAAILPAAADRLIIGGLPRARMPLLLAIFALAGGLALLAASLLRRENQLARLRSDFVASVSHELRTPLAQVRLFVETLRLGRARDETERSWALEKIERETLRLGALVENILHFSRAERGTAHVERERADLGAEVADAVRSFSMLLRAGRAELVVDAAPDLACELDRDAFRQVVLNLLDNAVKYGPAGQTIRVEARRAGERLVLAVEDGGPGIPPRERDRVWEAFQRGADAVGSSVAGSGIGLAVVREIVRAHGGSCRAEGARAGGARMVVELPALRSAAQAAPAPTAPVLVGRGAA